MLENGGGGGCKLYVGKAIGVVVGRAACKLDVFMRRGALVGAFTDVVCCELRSGEGRTTLFVTESLLAVDRLLVVDETTGVGAMGRGRTAVTLEPLTGCCAFA